MAKTEVPDSIRIHLPKEEFGEAYDGQWVDRTVRVGRDVWKKLDAIGMDYFRDDKVLDETADVLATVFTGWNLESNNGPLPQPWGNKNAFIELADSDFNLFIWLLNKAMSALSTIVASEKN